MFELLFKHPLWAYRTGSLAFASSLPLWLLVAGIVAGGALIVFTLLRRRPLTLVKVLTLGALQISLLALLLGLLWRPVLNVERVRDRENVLAVVMDTSASMALAEDGQSRLQQAVTALQKGAIDDLRKSFQVRLFTFDSALADLNSFESLPPPGAQTRIGAAVRQVMQTGASVPLAGIVLFSDGAENGNSLSEEDLAEISSYGVPVHTVGIGPERTPGDIELESIGLPPNAARGSTVTANVTVRHQGNGKTTIRAYDGETLLAATTVDLPAKTEFTTASVDFPAGESGVRDLHFTVDGLAGEHNLINNTRAELLSVPSERRSVLYLEGEPRWEYKFIRRALETDRSLRLASVVRTTVNKYYRQGVESAGELAGGFPANRTELFAYDAVIIGSYEAAALSPEQHQMLRDFVDRRGGSVLMLAGRSGLSDGGWSASPLAQTLPVSLPGKDERSLHQKLIKPELTLYGAQSPVTRLDVDAKRNQQRWQELTPLADYQALGKLRPGAIVLLQDASEHERLPLLVWQRFGRGSTFVLATQSTLRWQMHHPVADTSHETFWRQLAHALTDNATKRVSVTTDRTIYEDEKHVTVQAQVFDEQFEPVNDAQVQVQITPQHAAPFTQQMQPSGAADGRYTASIEAQSEGLYQIEMTAKTSDQKLRSASSYFRRNDGIVEQFHTEQNRPLLERLAATTAGRYWTLNDLSGLASAVPYTKAGIVEHKTLDLWNVPAVFLLLLLLKTTEWLLRLKWGTL